MEDAEATNDEALSVCQVVVTTEVEEVTGLPTAGQEEGNDVIEDTPSETELNVVEGNAYIEAASLENSQLGVIDQIIAAIKREEEDERRAGEGENIVIKVEDEDGEVTEQSQSCDLCDFTTMDVRVMKKHLVTHKVRKPPRRRPPEHKPYIKCDVCGYSTQVGHNMRVHKRIHTGEKPYACTWCDYRTRESGALGRHMKSHTGEKPHKCPLCDYKTAHSSILQTHVRTHTGEKPFKCKQCDYKAARSDALRQHTKIHADEKPYQCSICDFKTRNNNYLKRHLRTHTGERPYACNQCEYRATEGSALKRHMTIHTGEKQYSCFECGYMTDQASTLRIHVRKHTGEKPYACEYCDYRASRLRSVQLHTKTRHQCTVRLFPCSRCNFVGTEQDQLERHKETHRGEGRAGQVNHSPTIGDEEPAAMSGLAPPVIDESVKAKFAKRLLLLSTE